MSAAPSPTPLTPPPTPWMAWLGWTLAVACGLATAYATFRTAVVRTESALQRENAELAQIESKSLRQSLEAERILARRQAGELERAADPRQLQIAVLEFSATAPARTAVAIWNPVLGRGTLEAHALPELAPGERYEVWLAASGSDAPVRAGMFRPDASGSARLLLAPTDALPSVLHVTVTRERSSNPEPTGPVIARGSF